MIIDIDESIEGAVTIQTLRDIQNSIWFERETLVNVLPKEVDGRFVGFSVVPVELP